MNSAVHRQPSTKRETPPHFVQQAHYGNALRDSRNPLGGDVEKDPWVSLCARQFGPPWRRRRQTERRRARETSANWGLGRATASTNCGEIVAGNEFGSPHWTRF